MQEIIAFWTHASTEQVLGVMGSAQGYKFFDLWVTPAYAGLVLALWWHEEKRSRKFWLAVVVLVSLFELTTDIPCAAGRGGECVSDSALFLYALSNVMAPIAGVYFLYYCWRIMSK